MRVDNLDFIRLLLHRRAGLLLNADQEYLAETRLAGLALEAGCPDLDGFVDGLRAQPFSPWLPRVADALANNETSFFRDPALFEALRTRLLPELLGRRSMERSLSIWSAACSSGQEPYSLALLIREHFPQLAGWNLSLLATDFSEQMLRRVREGSYSQFEIGRGLPATLLVRYFERAGLNWQVRKEVRNMLTTRPLNLVEPWPPQPPMDLILLRNVMLYFDQPTRRAILERVRAHLRPDGYLILGAAESLATLAPEFRPLSVGSALAYQFIREAAP